MPVINFHLETINKAIEDGNLTEMAIYLYFKGRFQNSCMYNYHSRMAEIAIKAGISERTLYRYINRLRELNLVREHGKNLVLISLKDIRQKSRHKCNIKILKGYSIKDIESLLIAKIMENKGKQQAYMVTLREAKRRFKWIPYSPTGEVEDFAPSFSLRTIAKLVKSSEYQAKSIIKRLNDLGVIKTIKPKPRLIAENVGSFVPEMNIETGYRYVLNGNLYELQGAKHEFLEYPITKKPMSLMRYCKLLNKNVLPKR